MKELHNHIFSNTTCISKETMLKVINKQLSNQELHDVEKHLLECDFCSEAMEGIKIAKNSSVIFAIDHQIDSRVKMKSNGTFTIRNLMVAASIIAIIFGTYFTFNFLNKKPDTMAVNVLEEKGEEQKESVEENYLVPPPMEENKEEEEIDEIAVIEQKEERKEDDYVKESASKEEMVEEELSIEDIALNEPVEEAFDEQISDVSVSPASEKVREAPSLMAEKSVARQVASSKNKRSRAKSAVASVPSSVQGYTLLEDHKIVDYMEEYQSEYDLEEETNESGVRAKFETEMDQAKAEKELEKAAVEITYKEVLKSGIKSFGKEDYREALTQFNAILKVHPEDVNALFYGGLCQYSLGNFSVAQSQLDLVLKNKYTTFNQEAKWHKVLCLVGLNKSKEAKKILNEIIEEGGFYKVKAEEKLKGLK